MARARSIKPGFFKNEELAELPHLARLLYAGLWTLADREGRLEDRPKRVKAEVLPYDKADVDDLLSKLADKGFIVRYEISGRRCIAIPAWAKHQNPHHMEPPSEIPPPPGVTNRYNHTPIGPRQRAKIYARDGYKCVLCASTEDLQIDHIVKVCEGGTSIDDNLRTLCAQCNNKRSKKRATQDLSQSNPADSLNPEPLTLNPEPDLPEPDANPRALGTEPFQQFRAGWESIGKPVSEAEWGQVLHYWISENLDQHIEAVMPELRGYYKAKRDAIRDRDWEHVMFPLNWLKRRPWERKIAVPQRQSKPPTCLKCADTGMMFGEMKPGMSDAEWLETGRPCECGRKSKGEAA